MRTKTIFLSCFMLILMSCSESKKEIKPAEDVKQAFLIKKQEVSKSLKIPAELRPYEKADLYAKVEAFVQKVLVDIGDQVKPGQVLAVLDAPEAVARYAEADARYQEARARSMASLDRFNRLQEAAKEQGVVAEGELVHARNQMLADSSAIVSARSTAQAYKQLQDYLTIRAPFNGTVTSRTVDPGDLVSSAAGKPLFTVERPDRLRLRVHVPELYVNAIPAEEAMTFTTDAVVNKTFSAKLARKAGSISSNTRTELWEYEYDNTNAELKPGMYATALLRLNRPASSFVVPYTAVVTSLEKKFVIRIKAGQTEWVDVREGISLQNGIEIFGPLHEGDTLLTRGSEELKPEAAVIIKVSE